jgi:hypothetical protein
MPASVRFAAVYGFVDEYGDRWHWNRGDIVRNPYVVRLLLSRAAPVEVIEAGSPAGERIGE